ncbi:MAG TPA: hypothetical protein VJB02_02355 [Coxiellaceae bacterium]|nr:hypothetical protein [Coxiellaceae bacterium]
MAINPISSEKRFKVEISAILVGKIIAISILWGLCFSHPPVKHLSDSEVVKHILLFNPISMGTSK